MRNKHQSAQTDIQKTSQSRHKQQSCSAPHGDAPLNTVVRRQLLTTADKVFALQRDMPRPNSKKLKGGGQMLLFRCLETGFVTTAPALTRYQQARGIPASKRELVGERPSNWIREGPHSVCEHCGMVIKGNQWALRQHQQSKRCQAAQSRSRAGS